MRILQIYLLTLRATQFYFVLLRENMNFYTFLNELCGILECNSATKLYKKLGGKKTLSMGLRQFQSIFSGHAKPTIDLLMAVLRNIDFNWYRTATLAYFKSIGTDEDSNFIKYLEIGLRESVRPPDKKQWSENLEVKIYTEDQIKFLKSNPEVLRLHQKILLYQHIQLKSEDLTVVNQLCQINLAKIENNFIKSTANAFKIPTDLNSLPRTTSLASEYIIESMRTFLSFEGSENQRLEMVTQTISRNDLQHVLDETTKFKFWIQSLGQNEFTEEDSTPLIYVGFAKGLVKGEMA
jgi:hypothetical protein